MCRGLTDDNSKAASESDARHRENAVQWQSTIDAFESKWASDVKALARDHDSATASLIEKHSALGAQFTQFAAECETKHNDHLMRLKAALEELESRLFLDFTRQVRDSDAKQETSQRALHTTLVDVAGALRDDLARLSNECDVKHKELFLRTKASTDDLSFAFQNDFRELRDLHARHEKGNQTLHMLLESQERRTQEELQKLSADSELKHKDHQATLKISREELGLLREELARVAKDADAQKRAQHQAQSAFESQQSKLQDDVASSVEGGGGACKRPGVVARDTGLFGFEDTR